MRFRQRLCLRRLKKQEKIKVVFFLIHDSIWKYDALYRIMEQDSLFEPIVVVCPFIAEGDEMMRYTMLQSYAFCTHNGYNVVNTLKNDNTWLDVKQEINPDLIFFTNPHSYLTRPEYYIYNFKSQLTCYVPYGIMIANLQKMQFDKDFHNLLWKGFYETNIHKELAVKYARNKGININVSGYPLGDDLLRPNNTRSQNAWKVQNSKIKKIIWAPHHSIEENKNELAYSTFIYYSAAMFEILENFEGKIQIAFKPHPLLKSKLNNHPEWGEKRTNEYYLRWQNHPSGQLEESDYIDLFLSSDAMILDSISFIAEYLFTKKPYLFVIRDETIKTKFNEFGSLVFDLMYKAYSKSELINFIQKTVLENQDRLLDERKNFADNFLNPPNNLSASENIIHQIKKEIFNEVYI